ncbi:MAG: glycoside hydrolase family 15 protein [Ferruginibacter sp.]|nr:glycoside hydrolase family 15 protein [Cytophagales bacterium]
MKKKRYQPIGNYGIIGNRHTVALISAEGSIDFMCFTRFDSPTVFAALLDANIGGFFEIRPQLEEMDYKQLYLPDTAVLLTRFLSEQGVAEVTDFMPVKSEEKNCVLVRTVTVPRGEIPLRMRCQPRFDYARAEHTITGSSFEVVFTSLGPDQTAFRLLSNIPMTIEGKDVYAYFTVGPKQEAHFVLEAISAEAPRNWQEALHHYTTDSFHSTVNYWKDWIGKSKYAGRWLEMVNRSALTLKLLTSYQFGSAVAAPTFGLPSVMGGIRNWDYRYTWVRDAAFTMYAFLRLGLMEEAAGFVNWIEAELAEITDHKETLQLMYKVDGSSELEETTLPHLEGYEKSFPVRIGNAAQGQFQLDIYGELIDSIYLYDKYGGPITYSFWKKIEQQVEYVANNWQKADHGIWEVRNQEREFLQSRVMCWVALDRALRIAEHRSFPSPVDQWRKVRDEIYQDVYENFWNEEKKAFVQYKGSDVLDAAALLMPLVRFINPYEPRWLSTLEAIEEELVSDTLVYRYRTDRGAADGLAGEEGTFSICSFWYVECLSRSGYVEKARLYFEKMLGYANHLGLFAEQIGHRGEHLGNFPQAFTHLGLISTAFELNRKLDKRTKG